MRLVETTTFQLESFFGQPPPYAILSHTWGDEEATMQELRDARTVKLLKALRRRILRGEVFDGTEGIKAGLLKILRCAMQAAEDGFSYFWCDTCCIDKANSTELSESINSMYYWYKDQHCYAYLSDISCRNPNFTRSRWFTRGWTLQELIAPLSLLFFDQDWNLIGSRDQYQSVIAEDTGIDKGALCGEDPSRYSVATRMSWAAHRNTTRPEDLAYCLMGLFGINMPLIYGEKYKAFLRLQTEIMRISEDQSLFAWKLPVGNRHVSWGLLAPSPACFVESRAIGQLIPGHGIPPYSMTNRGIHIVLSMYKVMRMSPARSKSTDDVFFAKFPDHANKSSLGIYLTRNEAGIYSRYYPHLLIEMSEVQRGLQYLSRKSLYVAETKLAYTKSQSPSFRFKIHDLPQDLKKTGFSLSVCSNEEMASWDRRNRDLCCSQGLGAAISIDVLDSKGLVLLVGIDSNFKPRCAFDDGSDVDKASFAGYRFEPKKPLELARALLAYRTDESKRYESLMSNLRLYTVGKLSQQLGSKKIPMLIEDIVQRNQEHCWDTWISQPERTSSEFIDLSCWKTVGRPDAKFYQRRNIKFWRSMQLEVTASIKEEQEDDQKVFVVNITIESKRQNMHYR